MFAEITCGSVTLSNHFIKYCQLNVLGNLYLFYYYTYIYFFFPRIFFIMIVQNYKCWSACQNMWVGFGGRWQVECDPSTKSNEHGLTSWSTTKLFLVLSHVTLSFMAYCVWKQYYKIQQWCGEVPRHCLPLTGRVWLWPTYSNGNVLYKWLCTYWSNQ